MNKIDGRLVSALSVEDSAYALVRVRSRWHYGCVARRFDVAAEFPFINSVGIRCNRAEVERLAHMREVEFVTAQGRVSALDTAEETDASLSEITAGMSADVSDAAAEIFSSGRLTGEGVNLCVMDTGIAPHSDLSIPRDRIVGFADLIGGREFPYDDNGHGTFVAGVAAGNGLLSGGKIEGAAPCAGLVGVKVISASGETGTFKILEGMQWLYDRFRELNIKVVCMSFGADPVASADPLKLGAEMLTRSGLTVVCAAGNSGVGGLKSPGISSEVITVGAVDDGLNVAEFSSSGVYQGVYRPDIYAPGVKVRGVDAGGTYSVMSGTSVSAPYIAGACCLLHQKYRRLAPRDVKRMLIAASVNVRGARVFRLPDKD